MTTTVPQAGAVLGLSRSASYRAAAAGQIPSLRLGRRLVVPVPKLLRLIEGEMGVASADGMADGPALRGEAVQPSE